MRKRFTEIFGNENTKLRLSDAVLHRTVPHAMLIIGPTGSGKHTLARETASAILCENRDDEGYSLPCGVCRTCKRIRSGNFPDVSTLGRESGKATIGVEDIREYRSEMFLSATEADSKIFIIEDAELMTPAAQNALLKVLEEPPRDVHIILLAAETDKILTTVRSRTQIIQMERFGRDELKEYSTRLSETARSMALSQPERLDTVLINADGVLGRVLAALDEKSADSIGSSRALVLDVIAALPKKTPFARLYTAVAALPQKREELRHSLEMLIAALRDMMASKLSDDFTPIFFTDAASSEEAMGGMSTSRLMKIYDVISEALADLDKNVLVAPLLTDMTLKIKDIK
ncbi:MAG: AAA family ATPase [Ruminococcaceae bacterium]|nr:AAA family ATPase [Oscillospiraceae bacterium]